MKSETNFNELKRDVYEWSSENFGEEQPWTYPILGAHEEYGELVHSVLKRLQGIRLDEDGVGDKAEMDAVGDILVYIVDAAARFEEQNGVNVDIEGFVGTVRQFVVRDDTTVEEVMHKLDHDLNKLSDQRHNLSGKDFAFVVARLELFCEQRDFTIDDCVEEAWGEVQEREWESNVEVV